MLEFCDEHPTLLAFTAPWCGACKRVKPELEKLKSNQGQAFHFMEFTTDQVEHQTYFKQFDILGFPTIIIFDPAKKSFANYLGERSGTTMQVCLSALSHCTLSPRTVNDSSMQYKLVPHSQMVVPKVSEPVPQAAAKLKLKMCSDAPTVIAFTGVAWCGHCQRAQPIFDEWIAKRSELDYEFMQFDVTTFSDPPSKELELATSFGVEQFPTVLVFDPSTQKFGRFTDDLTKMSSHIQTKQPTMPWPTPSNLDIELVACERHSSTAATPSLVVVELKSEEEKERMTEVQELVEIMKKFQDENQHAEQKKAIHLQNFCADCLTIVVFTGMEWCRPCQVFQPELQKLKHHARHGKYHVEHIDVRMKKSEMSEDELINADYAEACGVQFFTTILIFNPFEQLFYEFKGPHQAQALTKCDMRFTQPWERVDVERVHIKLIGHKTEVTKVNMQIDMETNGEIEVCKRCPTTLVFAIEKNVHTHLVGKEGVMHVNHYNTKFNQAVISLFGIRVFPTVLVRMYEHSASAQSSQIAGHAKAMALPSKSYSQMNKIHSLKFDGLNKQQEKQKGSKEKSQGMLDQVNIHLPIDVPSVDTSGVLPPLPPLPITLPPLPPVSVNLPSLPIRLAVPQVIAPKCCQQDCDDDDDDDEPEEEASQSSSSEDEKTPTCDQEDEDDCGDDQDTPSCPSPTQDPCDDDEDEEPCEDDEDPCEGDEGDCDEEEEDCPEEEEDCPCESEPDECEEKNDDQCPDQEPDCPCESEPDECEQKNDDQCPDQEPDDCDEDENDQCQNPPPDNCPEEEESSSSSDDECAPPPKTDCGC